MTERAQLQFRTVEACGWYKSGEAEPVAHGFPEFVPQYFEWAQETNLLDTMICMGPGGTTTDRFYVRGVAELEGDYLIAGFVESHQEGEGILSLTLDGDQREQINTTPIEDGAIPGFPVYLWLIPRHNLLAAVRIRSRPNGINAFERHVSRFLGTRVEGVIEDPLPLAAKQRIVSFNVGEDVVRAWPRFKVSVVRLTTNLDELMLKASKVYAIEAKYDMSRQGTSRRSMFRAFKELLGLRDQLGEDDTENRYRLQFRLPANVTAKEIEEIANDLYEQGVEWENVGFHLTGHSTPLWLRGRFSSDSIDLRISRDPKGVYSAQDVLRAMHSRREELLRSVVP